MRQLLSKLLAGGLSAAVILLWYPQFFPSDSVESWLIRGVVWTFSFELMLLAFGPFEEALWETRAGRLLYSWLRLRLRGADGDSPRGQLRGRSLLAGAVLTVPIALLLFAPPQVVKDEPEAAASSVTHVTEVKRIVKVQRTSAPVADRGAPTSPSSTETRRAAAVNYEGDRASSRKTSGGKAPTADARDNASADTDAPAANETDSGSETAADVADTPATEAPAATNTTPAAGTTAGDVSTAPRAFVGA